MNKTLLEKQGWTHKWRSSMALYTDMDVPVLVNLQELIYNSSVHTQDAF